MASGLVLRIQDRFSRLTAGEKKLAQLMLDREDDILTRNAALAAHLSAQVGQTHRVLMEGPRMGRTEQFTEVAFDTDQPEGQIVLARIIGQAQGKLLAG